MWELFHGTMSVGHMRNVVLNAVKARPVFPMGPIDPAQGPAPRGAQHLLLLENRGQTKNR